jgi:hypothetical protein
LVAWPVRCTGATLAGGGRVVVRVLQAHQRLNLSSLVNPWFNLSLGFGFRF